MVVLACRVLSEESWAAIRILGLLQKDPGMITVLGCLHTPDPRNSEKRLGIPKSESVWRHWCRWRRSEIPCLLQFVCSFPRGRRLRANRQQLPGNVQKTQNSLETKKTKQNVTKKDRESQNKKTKKKIITPSPIYTNPIQNFPTKGLFEAISRTNLKRLKITSWALVAPSTSSMLHYLCLSPSIAVGPLLR